MSRYLQHGNITLSRHGMDLGVDFSYMGSAEFEFGSVPSALSFLRFTQCQVKVLSEVCMAAREETFKESNPYVSVLDEVCILAPVHTYSTGQTYMDLCVADFLADVDKARSGQRAFKEQPHYSELILSKGITEAPTLRPYSSHDFWLAVDSFVMQNGIQNRFSPEEAEALFAKFTERNELKLSKPQDYKGMRLDLTYVVVRKKYAPAIAELFALEKVVPMAHMDTSNIRMFDNVAFFDPKTAQEMKGKVVSILENDKFVVEANSKRHTVPNHCISHVL